MNWIDLLVAGKKVNNYEIDATGTTTLWPSDKIFKYTCPTGKRALVLGGLHNRDVSSTVTVRVMDSADKPIMFLQSLSAATGTNAWPNATTATSTTQLTFPIILDEDEYIKMDFATAQTAGAYATCVVIEFVHEL